MRIAMSGGHLTPAYSLAELAAKKDDSILLVGSRGRKSIESQELEKLGAAYCSVLPIKFDRYQKIRSLILLPLVIIPIFQSLFYLKKWQADVVVLFGSYNALSVGIAAWMLHIPTVLHEQTTTKGLANQLLKRIATACAVSYQTSQAYFPKHKTIVTGNLIRQVFWQQANDVSLQLSTKPIIYVTGGNQGSQAIIDALEPLLKELSKMYQIVLQVGKINIPTAPKSVVVRSWFSSSDTAYLMQHAHLMISRAGANTTAEIMVTGTPAILVPLPNTSSDEQQHNAELLAAQGAGIIIDQTILSPESLKSAIDKIEKDYQQYQEGAKKLKGKQNFHAANKLYDLISSVTIQS